MTSNLLAEFYDAPHQIQELLDQLPVGITLTDSQGRVLYYNPCDARLVDREPKLIGADVRACHQTPEAKRKIDDLLAQFSQGRQEPFVYRITRRGRVLEVNVTPVRRQGRFILLMHTLTPVEGGAA